MEAIARLRNCPTSPRKMRLVIDAIRGKNVFEALSILAHTRKHPARRVEKLLRSAIANWEAKNERNAGETEYIRAAYVDQGRTLKRYRPAPQGRATPIRKRSNHVTIIIDSYASAEEITQQVEMEEVKSETEETQKQEENIENTEKE